MNLYIYKKHKLFYYENVENRKNVKFNMIKLLFYICIPW